MAEMIPSDISYYNATKTEKEIYELLRDQLPEHFCVFFSVSWTEKPNRFDMNPRKGECDFLICSPHFGFLALEVKGGRGLRVENGVWYLDLNESEHSGEAARVLKRSPFKQAELSTYYFKNLIESRLKRRFGGIFGHAVCFPNFHIKEKHLGPEAPKEIIIDAADLDSLQKKITSIFNFWRGTRSAKFFPRRDFDLFREEINVARWYDAVYGRKLKEQDEIFETINRVQDNILDLTENFREAMFTGGAGTGKTWCAMKKAVRFSRAGEKVLFLCFNRHLADFIADQLNEHSVKVCSFHSFLHEVLGVKEFTRLKNINWELSGLFDILTEMDAHGQLPKYSSIIIDEGQDFSEEWALSLRLFLEDEKKGRLFVFYDPNQDIFGRSTGVDFEKTFSISYPSFRLTENLRNTAAIHKWSTDKTGVGSDIKSSPLDGIPPEEFVCSSSKDGVKKLEHLLNFLIDDQCINKGKIIVLSDRTLENSFLDGGTRVGRFRLYQNAADSLNPNAVSFKTVQSFKGLEADAVILLRHTESERQMEERNSYLEYVSYTRARHLLFVINIQFD